MRVQIHPAPLSMMSLVEYYQKGSLLVWQSVRWGCQVANAVPTSLLQALLNGTVSLNLSASGVHIHLCTHTPLMQSGVPDQVSKCMRARLYLLNATQKHASAPQRPARHVFSESSAHPNADVPTTSIVM